MNNQSVTALVPIKNSSERLKDKNFKDFCGRPLYQVILDKLQKINQVDRIFIDTDSDRIASESTKRYSKVTIIPRPDHIKGHQVTMNTIIAYDLTQIEGEHFLQTHATNPLLSEKTILEGINKYFSKLETYDSLFSVFKIKRRGYDHKGVPLNCSTSVLEQTQNLSEILIENSNLFLFSRSSFKAASNNRIGLKPQHLFMSEIESADIDYEHEFKLAELINKNKELFSGLD